MGVKEFFAKVSAYQEKRRTQQMDAYRKKTELLQAKARYVRQQEKIARSKARIQRYHGQTGGIFGGSVSSRLNKISSNLDRVAGEKQRRGTNILDRIR